MTKTRSTRGVQQAQKGLQKRQDRPEAVSVAPVEKAIRKMEKASERAMKLANELLPGDPIKVAIREATLAVRRAIDMANDDTRTACSELLDHLEAAGRSLAGASLWYADLKRQERKA